MDNFDRHYPAQRYLPRPIHHRRTAAAYLLQQLIITQHFRRNLGLQGIARSIQYRCRQADRLGGRLSVFRSLHREGMSSVLGGAG
ncbi:hypothetical protein HRbin36_02146 [bacterium HR36]|nr:hypothetical protein HRbin36_02146 [bacterium HR36]